MEAIKDKVFNNLSDKILERLESAADMIGNILDESLESLSKKVTRHLSSQASVELMSISDRSILVCPLGNTQR